MMRPLRLASLLAITAVGLACTFAFITEHSPSSDTTSLRSTLPSTAEVEAPPRLPDKIRTGTVTVRRGETLITVLSREGIGRRTSHEIASALADSGADLRRVRPQDELEISWRPDGEPSAVRLERSPWVAFTAIATDGGWEVQKAETSPDVRVEAIGGEVTRSLFEAVEAIGESPQLVVDLVHIFESEFDFTADTRQGDRFRLLVEKRYATDQFVDYGRILAAQYLSEEQALTGVAHVAHDGRHGYYDLNARSLQKTFLRAPLAFTRVTSGFTYRRPHPILGGVRPHLAVDYAAPVGTPVRAVADGVVLRAGWNGGNGIQVVLKHRSDYETMYNHLSKVLVKRGMRVSQGQIIGHVGSTGLSTGPHLDYRVSKRGRFVNPLNEKFLAGDALAGSLRAEFERKAKLLVRRLEEEVPFEPRT